MNYILMFNPAKLYFFSQRLPFYYYNIKILKTDKKIYGFKESMHNRKVTLGFYYDLCPKDHEGDQ